MWSFVGCLGRGFCRSYIIHIYYLPRRNPRLEIVVGGGGKERSYELFYSSILYQNIRSKDVGFDAEQLQQHQQRFIIEPRKETKTKKRTGVFRLLQTFGCITVPDGTIQNSLFLENLFARNILINIFYTDLLFNSHVDTHKPFGC